MTTGECVHVCNKGDVTSGREAMRTQGTMDVRGRSWINQASKHCYTISFVTADADDAMRDAAAVLARTTRSGRVVF